MKDRTILEYIEELSSSSPTPGGGSVGAVVLSFSVSLVSMVCNLTPGLERFIPNIKKIRDEFLNLSIEDEESFSKVMNAYSLPKNSEEEKQKRKEEIQKALKEATEVPLKSMRLSKEVIPFLEILIKNGNRNAISDVGVSILNLKSGVLSCYLNILINLKYIKDKSFNDTIYKEAEEIKDYISKWSDEKYIEVLKIVTEEK